MDTPLVSVVMAAYNRSNVLRHAVASVLHSTLADLELIVVDDASTDDTAAVVGSFDDPRLRFIRLEGNSGDQATPNNTGCRAARGRFVSFLNQDDLWFPDHLHHAVRRIEELDADWVIAMGFMVYGEDDIRVHGAIAGPWFDPRRHSGREMPACLWLVRREALERIGLWHPPATTRLAPSQELLYRGFRAGLKIASVPRATVMHFPTSAPSRRGCYTRRDAWEQERALQAMGDDRGYREALLTRAVLADEAREAAGALGVGRPLLRAALNAIKRCGLRLGVLPNEVHYALRYRRRGAFISSVRRHRGLGGEPGAREMPS